LKIWLFESGRPTNKHKKHKAWQMALSTMAAAWRMAHGKWQCRNGNDPLFVRCHGSHEIRSIFIMRARYPYHDWGVAS
jgi:hypothetical protein